MLTLAQKIRSLQGARSQVVFAAELGMRQSTLSQIYGGQRKVGIRIIRRLVARYPDSADELGALFLAENITKQLTNSQVA